MIQLRLLSHLLSLLVFLCFTSAATAMGLPLKVAAKLEPAEARRGAALRLVVTLQVDKGYHIYAMNVGEGEGPTATEIAFTDESPAVLAEAGPWVEPKATVTFDKGFERNIPKLYGSPLEFTRSYTVKPETKPGTYTLAGTIYVQACTEESCLPPGELKWSTTLTVQEGEAVTPTPSATAAPPTATPPPAAGTTSAPAAEMSVNVGPAQGFWRFVAGSFAFGLLSLLTPCVFPMIPITVSFFTNKKAHSRGQAVRGALVYVLSIIAGFTLIGFGVSVLVKLFGGGVEDSGFANRIASDPWINLGFAALYVFFALSLLEVIHLAVPQSISNRFASRTAGRSDTFGIVFKAIVFVLVSFTCTAPLVGILIVQTLQGEWTRPLFGLMAFSTGMALPFFALALAPQMLVRLPKSGSWLYSMKVVMALLVLAAAFKYFSNADLVWRKENMILSRAVLLSIWVTIAATITFYLFRFISLEADDDDRKIGAGRLFGGISSGVLALYMTTGLFGSQLHPWFEAYLPPDFSESQQVASGSMKAGTPLPPSRTQTGGDDISAGYSWFTNFEAAQAQARTLGKPIFVDFTGYSCTNCRLMEKTMFPRPEVAEVLEQFVRVKLYTDDREKGEERRAFQAKLFNTVSLPFYAVIQADGTVLATEAYTTDASRYVDFLKKGLGEKS